MTVDIKEVLRLHMAWLRGEPGGLRANLSGANLSGADLSGADLSRANLSRANLSGADLSRADLSGANLSGADLSRANLSRANLYGANLYGANLSRANLSGADLSRANLSRANLSGADLSGADLSGAESLPEEWIVRSQIVPQFGAFSAFKKTREGLVALLSIPADAKRLGGSCGRKCRASRAVVVALYETKEKKSRKKTATSIHDRNFVYTVGNEVAPDSFDENPLNECSNGIHFFLTFEEAAEYQ